MKANTEVESSGMDRVKLLLTAVILSLGVYGFYFFEAQPLWVRLVGILVTLAAAIFVALQTEVGRTVWRFSADARTEVRKVVWPTRQETVQTTLTIFIAVLVTALFLWGVDSLLFATVRYLTGQG